MFKVWNMEIVIYSATVVTSYCMWKLQGQEYWYTVLLSLLLKDKYVHICNKQVPMTAPDYIIINVNIHLESLSYSVSLEILAWAHSKPIH